MKLGQLISSLTKLQELAGADADTNVTVATLEGIWPEVYDGGYRQETKFQQEWSVKLVARADGPQPDIAAELHEIKRFLGYFDQPAQPAVGDFKPMETGPSLVNRYRRS